jgi:hypothetical protein
MNSSGSFRDPLSGPGSRAALDLCLSAAAEGVLGADQPSGCGRRFHPEDSPVASDR